MKYAKIGKSGGYQSCRGRGDREQLCEDIQFRALCAGGMVSFEAKSVMSQKGEFVRLALVPGASVSALCRRFGIEPAGAGSGGRLAGPPFDSLQHAQSAFDSWRHLYNTKRRHDGLPAPCRSTATAFQSRLLRDRAALRVRRRRPPAQTQPQGVPPLAWQTVRDVRCPRRSMQKRRRLCILGVFDGQALKNPGRP